MRNLPALVREKFKAAKAAGDITYFQTQLAILHCNSLPFQLRYSPALAHKPKSEKPKDTNQKPFNPFLYPPKSLLIAEVDSHNLQTHLLEEADLGVAYECLKSYRVEGEELFGFFNSGDYSGASQPHRHIQFLPVESMRTGLGQESQWSLLSDGLSGIPAPELPFTYFAASLPVDIQPSDLHAIYIDLHQQACQLMKATSSKNLKGNSSISYNLGFTDKSMVLCPRVSEGLSIQDNDGNTIGSVALNGTLLAGTLLVKSETEWDAVRKDEKILVDILKAIGVPRNTIDPRLSGPFQQSIDGKI
ncbi:hypothetical protein DID88_007445 [Monilinia fructigena]|uniref:Uncharacterized protein n=1 Tax=Monilinia fructigena TaxID=38457 RepID=A0A395J8G8_9HELO|nr:hypothetical protein DID88_007445 [Monilinia fructigena]